MLFSVNLFSLIFSDLFEKMVPMAVQQSMSFYSQRKAEMVNRLVGTMREATNLCNGLVEEHLYVSLQPPASRTLSDFLTWTIHDIRVHQVPLKRWQEHSIAPVSAQLFFHPVERRCWISFHNTFEDRKSFKAVYNKNVTLQWADVWGAVINGRLSETLLGCWRRWTCPLLWRICLEILSHNPLLRSPNRLWGREDCRASRS